MAPSVYRKVPCGRCISFSIWFRKPCFERMLIQAKLLITALVSRGKRIREFRSLLFFSLCMLSQ